MVIVALQEKSSKGRQHIPYRNSMMTSVLRDSLGGNCKTCMVATISNEVANTGESVSTCRFAQRVALVKNTAVLNEEVDPTLVIQRLKAEIKALKEEIRFLKGEGDSGSASDEELSSERRERLRDSIESWIKIPDATQRLDLADFGFTHRIIHESFHLFKELCRSGGFGGGGGGGRGSDAAAANDYQKSLVGSGPRGPYGHGVGGEGETEVEKLKFLLAQRDSEIKILVNMVKQGKSVPPEDSSYGTGGGAVPGGHNGRSTGHSTDGLERKAAGRSERGWDAIGERRGDHVVAAQNMYPHIDAAILSDSKKSFELFKERYPSRAAIEDNKIREFWENCQELGIEGGGAVLYDRSVAIKTHPPPNVVLRTKYSEAKRLGELVNNARNRINHLKREL